MFDPTEFVGNFWFGYIVRHCRTDYIDGSPLRERLNPLRYEIGFGRDWRRRWFIWNRRAWLNREWSNFWFRLRRAAAALRSSGGER